MLKHRFLNLILILIPFLMLSACSEDSNPVDDHGDHARGVGIKILQSGSTVVTYEYDDQVTGTLTAKAGEISAAYDFQLIDEDGDGYTPDDEHHSLQWTIANPDIASVWQHEGEEGGFEFHINGLSAGSTTIVFEVYHEGHADFVSKPVTIIVTQ